MTLLTVLSDILVEEPISHRIQVQNGGFILFTVCFFIIIQAIKAPKLIASMTKGIFRQNNKESIFAEQVNHEFIIKMLLCLQTIVLLFVFLYVHFSHSRVFSSEMDSDLLISLAKGLALIFVFLLSKFLLYHVVGIIFFRKEDILQWRDILISSIGLSGIVLFFPTLLLFYVAETYFFCSILYLIYFIFIAFLLSYKVYVLFFYQKSFFLYFILYLCAQEIIPLYFLYKGFGYLIIV